MRTQINYFTYMSAIKYALKWLHNLFTWYEMLLRIPCCGTDVRTNDSAYFALLIVTILCSCFGAREHHKTCGGCQKFNNSRM